VRTATERNAGGTFRPSDLGSSWIPDSWREQDVEQRFQQADAALSGIMHELEEADVQRQRLVMVAAAAVRNP
jgi:hypothetical protein